MAEVLDPNFGGGFDADEFRTQIRNTMTMGLPVDPAERPTFRWSVKRSYSIKDPSGDPYDWGAAPTSVDEKDDVQVPVAVDFSPRSTFGVNTPAGQIDNSRAVLTILDVDYEEVKTADQVLLNGDVYEIDFVAPSTGLFSVTVYEIHCSAVDES